MGGESSDAWRRSRRRPAPDRDVQECRAMSPTAATTNPTTPARAVAVRRARPRRVGGPRRLHREPLTPEEIDPAARPRGRARPRRGPAGLPAAVPPAQHVRRERRPAAPAAGGVPRPAAAAAHAVRDRAGRLGRGRQVDDRPRAAADAGPLARAPAASRWSPPTASCYPNAELERRGLLHRKGFPESYDRKALLRFVIDIKSGKDEVEAPTYSHLVYDVVPDEKVVDQEPGHRDHRGPQRAPAGPGAATTAAPAWRSATSSTSACTSTPRTSRHPASGTSTGSCGCARPRSATRTSYFAKYAALTHDEAVGRGGADLGRASTARTWSQNILPTRSRATLVLRKDPDHSVRYVRLRKL